jgi:exodeoxyribonuclease VII small subunit
LDTAGPKTGNAGAFAEARACASPPDEQCSRPMSPAAPEKSAPSFEDAIKRLSEIVTKLEKGDLALEESLKLFEEGVNLSRLSQERLDAAQKKVEELLGVDAEGNARTAPFETTGEND